MSVKNGRDKFLTRSMAMLESKEREGDFSSFLYDLSMVVQDPFDLSHNVSKLVKVDTFERWCRGMAHAFCVLEQQSKTVTLDPSFIMALFDVPEKVPEEVTRSEWSMPLVFSVRRVHRLLSQGKTAVLAQSLAELDLSSISVRQSLGQLVLRAVVELLRTKYSFTCLPGEQEGAEEEQETVLRRGRVQYSQGSALDLLMGLTRAEPHPLSYTCSTHHNTWLDSERAHGHPHQVGEQGEGDQNQARMLTDGLAALQALSQNLPTPPLLQLEVYLLPPGASRGSVTNCCVLKVKRIQGSHEDYFTFLAFLKKLLIINYGD